MEGTGAPNTWCWATELDKIGRSKTQQAAPNQCSHPELHSNRYTQSSAICVKMGDFDEDLFHFKLLPIIVLNNIIITPLSMNCHV